MDFAALQHSVFLHALGSAILNSFWQACILWLLYETISVCYKNASARFKNNLSTILLFFSFILFLISLVSKIINHQQVISITAAAANTEKITAVHSASVYQQFLSYANSSIPYLSVAYIFLLFFLMAKLFTAYRYVYIISNKRLLNPPGELQAFANKVSMQMKITRKISVWISHHIDVPATIGFIKPVILIPFASLNNLSIHQLEAIILHELSHIKRSDYVINIIIAVIETILFFNPFVALLSNIIKRERENCCDDFVLQYQYDPHSYASALLRLEQSRTINLKLAIGVVSGKKQLLSRIKRITNAHVSSRQFNYGQKLLALLLVTAIICSLAWLSPGENKPVSHNILQKDIEVKKTFEPTYPSKTLTLTDAPKENLQVKILKLISPKKELPLLNETSDTGFAVNGNNELNVNEYIPAGIEENISAAMNYLKSSQFFLNESKLKLPQSININHFPFQNAAFKIDVSKIDMSQLNENLKQAYKEINKINWNEVQNNIRESFSKMNVSNFPPKEQARFFVEKAKGFSQLKIKKEKFDKVYFIDKLNKEIQLQDSLNSKMMKMVYNNNARIQRQYKAVQKRYAEAFKNNSYFTYSTNKSSEKNTDNKVKVNENNELPSAKEYTNIKIEVKHSPKPDGDLHQKKFLQFSFDSNTQKPGHKKVINVELMDLP